MSHGTPHQDPHHHHMSTGQKVAIGVGVAAVGAAALGAVAVGAVGVGAVAHHVHATHEEKTQMASPLRLTIRVIRADNLVGKDSHMFHHSTSDPYVAIQVNHVTVKTAVIPKNLNPVWNETFDIGVLEKDLNSTAVKFHVYDKDTAHDDSLGTAEIHLPSIPHGPPTERVLKLQHAKHGDLHIAIGLHHHQAGFPGAGAPGYGSGGAPPGYGAPYGSGGAPPGYGAPPPGYGAPYGSGGAPPGYGAPPPGYGAPAPGYGAPYGSEGYPPAGYGAPAPGYGAPPPGYGAPAPGYGAPPPGYGAPGYGAPPPY